MKKAINAWSVPGNVSFEDMFAAIAAAGFNGIELNIDKGGASAHSLGMEDGPALYRRIGELSRRHALPVCGISTSLYGGTLGSGDRRERERGRAILRKQLEAAAALRAGAILAVPGGIGGETSIRQAWDNTLETLSALKPEIEAGGIGVGLENVWNGFFASPFDMARMIDELDCPLIGAYFDAGNVRILSPPEYWIEILGRRILRVHVKDFQHGSGYRGSFVNLLEGDIRWDRVMEALRAAGYDGTLTAELPAMARTPEYLYAVTSAALDVIINKGGQNP